MTTTRSPRAKPPSSKSRSSKPRRASPLQRLGQFGVMAVAAAALASCAVMPTSRYPAKSDVKPHAGVARAHDLPIHGIDVSKWQGAIDWASVRGAGTQFVFIKATEGGDHVDERFMENWNGAAAAGIPRGAWASSSSSPNGRSRRRRFGSRERARPSRARSRPTSRFGSGPRPSRSRTT